MSGRVRSGACPLKRCPDRVSLIGRSESSLGTMDNRAEVREFLMSRRAKITPERVGLPSIGNRRVPGLRRSEVATLAGLSVEYYSKLERGTIGGASASVLEALARALQLNETERAHLVDLARAADGIPTSGRHRRPTAPARPPHQALQWVLDSIKDSVAFIRSDEQDLVAVNELGRAFYSPVIGDGGRTPNLARFQFLDPASKDFYPDWELFAQMCVAIIRNAAGKDPHHRGIQDLVGELSTRSETFRELWAAHDVRTHGTGTKRFNHPDVGKLNLAYEELSVTAEEGLVLMIYAAEPGSESYQKLQMLASWNKTQIDSAVA